MLVSLASRTGCAQVTRGAATVWMGDGVVMSFCVSFVTKLCTSSGSVKNCVDFTG
jgi:hypothetical protein